MQKEKLLITGSNGFLGNILLNYFNSKGYSVLGTDLSASLVNPDIEYLSGDLTDQKISNDIFDKFRPNYVINTVALVDIDLCEENMQLADKVNVQTAKNIAKHANKYGARMIHISTDHLFDGRKPYYSEEDNALPINNYGVTKLEAEQVCLANQNDLVVVRTNFYGWSHSSHRLTFGEWLYTSLLQKLSVKLFIDYYFTPIEVTALAEAIDMVMRSDFKGILNIAGAERCSKYEFGMAMAEVFGFDTSSIAPAKMNPESFKVKRQQDLSLSTEKFNRIFAQKLPDLKTGLQRFKNTKPKDYKKI